MNAAVKANLNKGAKSWALPPKACCSAEVACLLMGYFQLLLATLLYSPLCVKMFQSKHELSLLCQGLCRQVTGVYSPSGSLSWPVWDRWGIKIGECDSPGYCSPRPLDDTWLLSRVCIGRLFGILHWISSSLLTKQSICEMTANHKHK